MISKDKRVGIFIPVGIDQFAADTGMRMVTLLESLGISCHYPEECTSCGMELYQIGDQEGAKLLGEKTIELYNGCDYIVSCCSGCVTYMKRHFGDLFVNTIMQNENKHFANKVYDLSDFLVNVIGYTPNGVKFPYKVAFMDHCATRHDYVCSAHPDKVGLYEEPRTLLRAVEGLQLVDEASEEVCCGYGGIFANMYTPVSDSLARRKANLAINAGAEYIVSTEISCLLHMQSYIDKAGMPLKCRHLVDVLSGVE